MDLNVIEQIIDVSELCGWSEIEKNHHDQFVAFFLFAEVI